MKPVDYDYSPTFLGGVGSILEYRHKCFLQARDHYIQLLNEVRTFESESHNEPVCVKTFSKNLGHDDCFDSYHPRHKARFYSEIEAYIKKHSSVDWVFAHVEEDVVEHPDPYDDYSEYELQAKIFATIKQKATLEQQETYKGLVKQLESAFEELEESKAEFIQAVKDM